MASYLPWEIEKIVKSEIITYTRKLRRVNKGFKELHYFVKWAGCSEDENTWEPQEGLVNGQDVVEKFHRENPGMPGPNLVELYEKGFPQVAKPTLRVFTPTIRS